MHRVFSGQAGFVVLSYAWGRCNDQPSRGTKLTPTNFSPWRPGGSAKALRFFRWQSHTPDLQLGADRHVLSGSWRVFDFRRSAVRQVTTALGTRQCHCRRSWLENLQAAGRASHQTVPRCLFSPSISCDCQPQSRRMRSTVSHISNLRASISPDDVSTSQQIHYG